ncbi:MAG: outer membrane beta-barrel protein [Dysgonomonas sp.]
MKAIISIFFLLFFSCAIYAQTSITIKGQLVDEESKPIPYATLSVSNINDTLNKKVVKRLAADDNGKFSFQHNHADKLQITASYIGQADLVKDFEVSTSEKILDLGKLVMKPSTEELAGVTVIAQKPLVKVDIDKLTYNTQDDPESQTSNALDMLRKVPLVTIDGDDKIQVKGSSSYKVLVNGKPSNMFTNSPEKVFKSMPASSIKNVEVITEPGAKYDAEGVSAIINIITEKNSTDGYTGSVGAGINSRGSYNGNLYLALKYGKLGFTGNGSYYTWRQPEANSSSVYEIYSPYANTNRSTSPNKYDGRGFWGSALFSYEIDSLNLLSLSLSNYTGHWDGKTSISAESSGQMIYSYNQINNSKNKYGGGDMSLDYQKSFMKPGRLLTFSYKLGQSPYDSESNARMNDIVNPNGDLKRTEPFESNNNTESTEHTGQIDYVEPLSEKHNIEAGLKFIHRDNNSKGFYYEQNSVGEMIEDPDFTERNKLSQLQNVFSGYGSYQYKTKKMSVKAGVRFDRTNQNLFFANEPKVNAHYFDFIPSIVYSYQLGTSKTIKTTYNMRVSRPGIWQLNPYESTLDSLNISMGNPKLDSERSHSFDVTYSSFTPKFMINASLGYSWTNNAIASFDYIENRGGKLVTISTSENIGKNQRLGANLYFNWNPNQKLRIYVNASTNYLHFDRSGTNALKNGGWESNMYGGGSYNLPKDFRFNFGGNLYQYGVGLQSDKATTGYSTYIAITKELLNKKLSIGLSARDPFWYKTTMTSTSKDVNFWRESKYERIGQSFGINISYRFGDLKSNIKKVERSINNDDVKSGGGGQQGGQQGN